MPIEIRELTIKAQISSDSESDNRRTGSLDNAAIQKIVQECVDMVMEIIKKERER